MKRGEIWTLRDRQYASKARPVIVIQNDAYDNFDSVILCLFTTYDSSEIEVRVPVIPTPENGLHDLSYNRVVYTLDDKSSNAKRCDRSREKRKNAASNVSNKEVRSLHGGDRP